MLPELSANATSTLTEDDLENGGLDIVSILVKSGLVPSRSEGRRAVQQGGVTVDGEKIDDFKKVFAGEALEGEGIL